MEAALRWLAAATPGSAELLRLMDATRSGAVTPSSPPSALTWQAGRATATAPAIPAGTGGSKLLIICTCDGTITGFGLANPKLHGERQQVRQALEYQPANRPTPGTAPVTDKGPSGEGFEEFTTSGDLGLVLIRPARKDENSPRPFPNWLRQRVEAIIWTLKNQLGLERHGGRVPPGCGPGSSSACSPSTPPSGTTGRSAPPSNAP
jgi:hypothetical protein